MLNEYIVWWGVGNYESVMACSESEALAKAIELDWRIAGCDDVEIEIRD